MKLRTVLVGAGAAWELAAILTRRVPTISEVWYVHRGTHGRHVLYWLTGYFIWHLWGEHPITLESAGKEVIL